MSGTITPNYIDDAEAVTQVTEREWLALFETFPPYCWKSDNHGESWSCPEMTSGEVSTIGVRIGDEYFMFSGNVNMPHQDRCAYVASEIESGNVELSQNQEMTEQHGDAWEAFGRCFGEDYVTPEQFDDAYCGQYDSELDYAYEIVSKCYPEISGSDSIAAQYFNYEAFARGLFSSDNIRDDETGHVFRRDF